MSDTAMCTIDELRVHPIQLAHAAGKIALRRLNDDVVMIGHLAQIRRERIWTAFAGPQGAGQDARAH